MNMLKNNRKITEFVKVQEPLQNNTPATTTPTTTPTASATTSAVRKKLERFRYEPPPLVKKGGGHRGSDSPQNR